MESLLIASAILKKKKSHRESQGLALKKGAMTAVLAFALHNHAGRRQVGTAGAKNNRRDTITNAVLWSSRFRSKQYL